MTEQTNVVQNIEKTDFFADVNKSVQDSLRLRNPEIAETLKKKLVDELLAKRASLLMTAMHKRKDLDGKCRSLKDGDIKHFDENGTVVATHFSKDRLDKRKQAEQELKKFDEALDRAVNDASWESLEKLLNTNSEKQ